MIDDIPLASDNVFVLPLTNSILLKVALEDAQILPDANLWMRLKLPQNLRKRAHPGAWRIGSSGGEYAEYSSDQLETYRCQRSSGRFDHAFPDFLLSSRNFSMLGLIIECGAGSNVLCRARVHFAFNPSNHYQLVDLEAKDLLKKYVGLTAYDEREAFTGVVDARQDE